MAFTPQQTAAIFAKNRELLVSAAAGSGKTAVLVERILHLIRDEGLSIDRMLIVTFTRAAAGEMRERLETRLLDAAGGDRRMQRQADLVASAQISTIHSYCQQVVRQHFQRCGVDPQFMLLDDRARAVCYERAQEETLDWLYQTAHEDEALRDLAIKFTEREIAQMLDQLYRFLMSRPHPMAWLQASADVHWTEQSAVESPMAEAFLREAALIVDGMRAVMDDMRRESRSPAFPPAYQNALQSDAALVKGLDRACAQGLAALTDTLSALKFETLKPARPQTQDEADSAERLKALRARLKALAEELKKLLPGGFAQGVSDMAAMERATQGLAKAAAHFHEAFTQQKRDEAAVDFQDLEHLTLAVLDDPDLRAQQAARFDAIFVDEYQDVSELQEAILNALKRPEDDPAPQYCFYVGDVKQSIYRFRLAEPRLFLRKLQGFSPEEDAPRRRIILNRNFRSRENVLDAVNRVFEHVMDSRVTEIDYDADARLNPGFPSQNDPETQLHILNSTGKRPQDVVLCEAELIARDILQSVGTPTYDAQGQPNGTLGYRDFAILLPVSKNVADKVELVLMRHGIPVYCEGAQDPMQADEVVQLIQHLSLLDNLMNDLALIAVLRGPMFDMTEHELAQVRLHMPQRGASFFAALALCAREADAPLRARCEAVLHTLERERFYARSMPLSQYLWSFLGRSGLYAHYGAQPGGKQRQANLRMLCHRAAEHERTRADGLSGFVASLTAMQGGGQDASPAVLNPWEHVVRIMTIHKSKGLEFPVVYVMGLGRSLLGRAQSRLLSVHGRVGLGLHYVNERARTRRSTLMQAAVALGERSAERAERARVLYVAMTRPKTRLVLVGSAGEKEMDPAALRRRLADDGRTRPVRDARSMLDWLLQCVRLNADTVQLYDGEKFSTLEPWETPNETHISTESTSFPQKHAPWRVVFHIDPVVTKVSRAGGKRAQISLPVPADAALSPKQAQEALMQPVRPIAPGPEPTATAHAPLKLGVTALCRALEGLEAMQDAAMEEGETVQVKRLPELGVKPKLLSSLPDMPAFLAPPPQEVGALRGVATHKLLSLLSLDGARAAAPELAALKRFVQAERERMVQSRLLDASEGKLADVRMAARFLAGDMGRRMLRADTVMREWSFNLRVHAPVDTVLQGVIDLCFLEDGGWVLLDFKTDAVKSAAELWPRYGRQLGFYAQALRTATPYPVRERALCALSVGEVSRKYDEET